MAIRIRIFCRTIPCLVFGIGLFLGDFRTVATGFAQEPLEDMLWEDFEGQEDPELLAILDRLHSRPIDLNKADPEELAEFPFFSLIMAEKIAQERSRKGPYRSWENVRKRLGLSKFETDRIKPYFRLKTWKSSRSFSTSCRWTFRREFPLAQGYAIGLYPGSPWKCAQRILISGGRLLRIGLVLDKDPGEKSWSDFTGFSLRLDKTTGMDRVCIGNLAMRSGQGLVFGNPLGMAADPLAPIQGRSGDLSVSSSTVETGNPFGIGISKSIGPWRAFVFAARLAWDASLDSDGSVKSLDRSGFHRTGNEITRKRNLGELLIGGRIETGGRLGKWGISAWTGRLSRSFGHRAGSGDVFDFFGNRNTVWGADWDFGVSGFRIAGEWARSESGRTAWVVSANAQQRFWSFSWACHGFDPGFHNDAAGWSGSGSVENESGFAAILSHVPAEGFRWGMAYRAFRRPWRTYTLPMPSEKDDWTMRFDAERGNRKATFLVRLRRTSEKTDGLSSMGLPVHWLQFRNRVQIRIDLKHRCSTRFKHEIRLERTCLLDPGLKGIQSSCPHREDGFLLFECATIHVSDRFSLVGRWTVFESGSWQNRQTVWEDDVPGIYSIRSLYGRGTRWFVLVRFGPVSGLKIHARIGEERKEDIAYFGSGNDRTPGNKLRTLSLALEWNSADRTGF